VGQKLGILGALQGLEKEDIRNRLAQQQLESNVDLFPAQLESLRERTANAADFLAIQQAQEGRSAGREPLNRQSIESRLLTEGQARESSAARLPLVLQQLEEQNRNLISSRGRAAGLAPGELAIQELNRQSQALQNIERLSGFGGFPRALEAAERERIPSVDLQQRLTDDERRLASELILAGDFDNPDLLRMAELDNTVRDAIEIARRGRP